jgi:hypothetical protein
MTKCDICPNQVVGNHKYCPTCANFVQYVLNGSLHAEVLRRIQREDGFHCEYSDARLNLKNTSDPFYLQFDHPVPVESKYLKGSAAIVNQAKVDMTWLEFPVVSHEFVNCLDTGEPFNKKVVPFSHWGKGQMLVKPTNTRLVEMAGGARLLDARLRLPKSYDRVCWICQKYAVTGQMRYCPRCKRLLNRRCDSWTVLAPALKAAYIPNLDTFLDFHFGVPLELYNFWDPFYLSFDHPVPGLKGKVVVTSVLGNMMKADMDVEEFHAFFRMLDCHFLGGKFEQDKLEFKYFQRNYFPRKVA